MTRVAIKESRIEHTINRLLILEFDDYELLKREVRKWTAKQRILVNEFAAREILVANDNEGVKRLKTPKVIEKLRTLVGVKQW